MSVYLARVSAPLVLLMFWVAALLLPTTAAAHESQPGLLELRQLAEDRWELVWRAPIYYGRPRTRPGWSCRAIGTRWPSRRCASCPTPRCTGRSYP